MSSGLKANKALGFFSCFISLSAAHLMLYFLYNTHGNALTLTYGSFVLHVFYGVLIPLCCIHIRYCTSVYLCMFANTSCYILISKTKCNNIIIWSIRVSLITKEHICSSDTLLCFAQPSSGACYTSVKQLLAIFSSL